MEVIKEICNKVAVISEGEIVEQGPTFELFSKPSHPVTKRFIGDKSLEGPWGYTAKDKSSKLYKLTFLQESAHQPVISQLIKTTGVEVNIIAGHISNVQGRSYGNLIIEISGSRELLEKALQYLIEKNLFVEELADDERVV
jgi:D-methionine transport system ATP-binding protein